MSKEYVVSVGYPLSTYDSRFDATIDDLIGRVNEGTRTGMGRRDLVYYFGSESERDSAIERVREAAHNGVNILSEDEFDVHFRSRR